MTLSSKSVCVFCGSRKGELPGYMEKAEQLGRKLAEAGIRLVYGGGDLGIMGAVARGTMESGGKVTGIIPDFLIHRESVKESLELLDEVHITTNMHDRKMMMFEKSDAFVALPGGIGTLEELVEQMTWAQLGQHQKPVLIANFEQFWTPFFDLINHMRDQGFIGGDFNVNYLTCDTENEIVEKLNKAWEEVDTNLHSRDKVIRKTM